MDGRFLKAFSLLPTQKAVCGYVTKPICFRHRMALMSIESPFVTGTQPQPLDLLVAARIMSHTDLDKMLSRETTKHDVDQINKMVDDNDYFVEQTAVMSKLIEQQSCWPVFWSKKSGGKDRGAPWILSLICNLVKSGIPMEEAWTMPESQAVWIHATMSINAGVDIDIVSDEDLAAIEQLKKMEEELKKNPPQPPPHMRRAMSN